MQLIASRDELATHATRKAVNVKDLLLCASHQILWQQALMTTRTLRTESPEEIVATKELALAAKALFGERLTTIEAVNARLMPRSVENVVEIGIENGLVASGA